MFKLPHQTPDFSSKTQEWADYSEYLALQKNSISFREVFKIPELIEDEIDRSGVEDISDKYIDKIDEIAEEIKRRYRVSNGNYPFELTNMNYSLSYQDSDKLNNWVYKFLLFATRLRMSNNRIHAGIDGALLFEELSSEIAISYFGENSNAAVLGTSSSGSGGFSEKLKNIAVRIGEGGDIRSYSAARPQDDKIDVIVWKGFSDKVSSQLIGFGQCKTGTSWLDKLSELSPDVFCRTWFTQQPILTPVKMFFCAQYFPKEIWPFKGYHAGLIFDRFRILDYLPDDVPEALLDQIRTWTIAASANNN